MESEEIGSFSASGVRVALVADESGLRWKCDDGEIKKTLDASMRVKSSVHPDSLGYPYWWFGMEALEKAGFEIKDVKEPPRVSIPDNEVGVNGNPIP